jgi:hypothetical protein
MERKPFRHLPYKYFAIVGPRRHNAIVEGVPNGGSVCVVLSAQYADLPIRIKNRCSVAPEKRNLLW